MLSDRCLFVLSVCNVGVLVYCGQTNGWIKMLLGTEVCLGPGHIVLDRDPAPHSDTGTTAPVHFSAHCCGTVAHLSNC